MSRPLHLIVPCALVLAVLTPSAASGRVTGVDGTRGGPVEAVGVASLDTVLLGARTQREAPARGVWPLRPRPDVARGFEPPAARWGAGHRGVDLTGVVGARVRSALPGTVAHVGRIAGRGVVVVDHGPTRTTYEPVMATVARGTRVAAGDVIGRLAAVGSHCGFRACLHWGWRRGDTYLDPLRLVDAPQPVRLLPW